MENYQTLQIQGATSEEEIAFRTRLQHVATLTGTEELAEYTQDTLQLPLTSKSWSQLKNTLARLLLNLTEDNDAMVSCLRLLNSGELLKEVISSVFSLFGTNQTNDLATRDRMNTLLSTVLQFTDQLNFRILKFYSDFKTSLDPFQDITSPKQLHTIFRLFDAQLFMRTLWDTSPLYLIDVNKLGAMDGLICWYLRQMIHNDVKQHVEMSDERLKTIRLIDALRLNKKEERRRQSEMTEQLGEIQLYRPREEEEGSEEGLVSTPYLASKVEQAQEEIENNVFRHFAVFGDEGSGKMSFVRLLRGNSQQKLIVVTLEETFDSKNLVGTYVCNETGEFVFKKGPLTVAAEQGMWLILRNIDQSPPDLLSFLLPLVQESKLQVTSAFSITPKLGFRIIALSNKNLEESSISPFVSLLHSVHLDQLQARGDFGHILKTKYRYLHSVSWMPEFLGRCVAQLEERLDRFKGQLLDHKPFSIKQTFKLFERVDHSLRSIVDLEEPGSVFISSTHSQHLLLEIADIYLAHVYDKNVRSALLLTLATAANSLFADVGQAQLAADAFLDYAVRHTREYGVSDHSFYFGRSKAVSRELEQSQPDQSFVYTSTTLRLMEQVCVALQRKEALLLVGETGTGKTSAVQELAKLQGKRLHVFNMNQNTDSADLLGGFKPVDIKFLLKPVYEQFLGLFRTAFKSDKNQKFLDLLQKCYEENQIREFIQCLGHGLASLKGKSNGIDQEKMTALETMIQDLQKRAQKLESGGGFIFQFIEGTLIKSLQCGDWVLLDEINLASDAVLNKLSTIIEGHHILLNERADIVETKLHPDFRIFMCMNPPYTSAGKKQLPAGLRVKLTELYVPELELETDLWPIVDRNAPSTMFSERQKRQILEFYLRARSLVFNHTKRGNVGLRNLSRSLKMMQAAVNLKYPVIKAIYDALYTCFASHLDSPMQQTLHRLIFELFEITTLPSLDVVSRSRGDTVDKFAYVEEFIIPKGGHPTAFVESDFILTPTFRSLVKRLASIVSVTDYAVILEGPTSAGKTSTVQYLANVTQNKVIRINNHMHTDIQEYLGSYVPSQAEQDGKLVFQEGVLVEAVRHGYWVILDELNLAPSEVLEALNRLLDDNRELHIVETQKTIKAHPNFRIFATQNPTEGYGGRKELSEAFKNRFILIKVGDVPTDELQEILIQKCGLPKSRATLMVRTMENLQIYRSQSSLFSGKDSTITVRDLLKWANRVNTDESMVAQDIALEGYLVLGERSRSQQDKQFIKKTIETTLRAKIDEEKFYESYFDKYNLAQAFADMPTRLGIPRLVVSRQLRRLAVLVHKCLRNKEPVLLVGETGCGKTTLCQVFAALNNQQLFSINCHQNTETSDFIGCMRTRKNLQKTQEELVEIIANALDNELSDNLTEEQIAAIRKIPTYKKKADVFLKALKPLCRQNDRLKELYRNIKSLKAELSMVFEWHDGILVEAMQAGGLLLIDEISLANDSVLERLNSVFEQERMLILSEKSSSEAIKIVGQEGFNIVATMNPSGDFGKKELSPALRNRMTEIWVESYFEQKELIDLYQQATQSFVLQPKVHKNISTSIDLYLIILKMCESKLDFLTGADGEKASLALFNMIGFVNFTLAGKFTVLQRKALSIRDVINAIDFIKVGFPLFQEAGEGQLALALYHAISLVIMDGLCLGIDVAGDQQKEQISGHCTDYLEGLLSEVCLTSWKEYASSSEGEFVNTETEIGVRPFILGKKAATQSSSFAFDAKTTKSNLHRLLRAFQLQKPTLIEGPPGVGKTSLVENLARMSGRQLTRVNLSEQTDMMDLLGSEYPTTEDNKGSADSDDIQFRWCDGALLRAIKEGHWFLIDEMNLAQQSVLEGLNAILDHRRTVYIPELNQEFQCHPDFFVFACQNPSQSSSSVGGRKTLPKSFLNRFNKIYLEELTQDDYSCILERQIQSDSLLAHLDVAGMLGFSQTVESVLKQQTGRAAACADEGAVNLRDLNRLFKLYRRFIQETNGDHDLSLAQCIDICYLQKVNNASLKDQIVGEILAASGLVKDIENVRQAVSARPLVRILANNQLKFDSRKPTVIGNGLLDLERSDLFLTDILRMQGAHTKSLQFLADCLHTNFPLLVVTNDCRLFIRNLQAISQLWNKKLNRILLNDRSDTTQLLGCFEQTSQDLAQLQSELVKTQIHALTGPVISLQHRLSMSEDLEEQIGMMEQFLDTNWNEMQEGKEQLLRKLNLFRRTVSKGQSRFEWVDSVLVNAIERGEWAVFENANLCNPSILDRLNSLLEEGNHTLSINEQGLVEGDLLREVKAHEDFRPIFLINKKTLFDQGRDVSRALRNRCLLIDIQYQIDEVNSELGSNVLNIAKEVNDLVGEQDGRVLDAYHQSLKFDFYPLMQMNSSVNQAAVHPSINSQEAQVQLGKRGKPSRAPAPSASKLTAKLSKSISGHEQPLFPAYLFQHLSLFETSADIAALYLQNVDGANSDHVRYCLNTISQRKHEDGWFAWYLNYQVHHLTTLIKQAVADRQSKIVLTNTSHQILAIILQQQVSTTLQSLNDRFLLLRKVYEGLCLRGQVDILQSHSVIFMLQKLQAAVPAEVVRHLASQHGEVILNALLNSSDGLDSRLGMLEQLQPNAFGDIMIKELSTLREWQEDLKQNPLGFVWVKTLSDEPEAQGSVKHGLGALEAQYTIMCLNDEKEILKKEELDGYTLAELISEASPFLVLIPKAEATITMSASSQYPSLCLLKDAKKLCRATSIGDSRLGGEKEEHGTNEQTNKCPKRLSWLLPIAKKTPDVFVRCLNLLNLEKMYDFRKSVEVSTMDRILCDEVAHLTLRDLPSFYACATNLLSQMKYQLDNLDHRDQLLDFTNELQEDIPLSALSSGYELQETLAALRDNLERQSSQTPRQIKSIDAIIRSFGQFQMLETTKIIEAMLVLPFEHARLQELAETQTTESCLSELRFWQYHLRNISAAHDCTKPIRAQIQVLEEQVVRLAALLPSSELHQRLLTLLKYVSHLIDSASELCNTLIRTKDFRIGIKQLLTKCELINQLLIKGQDLYYAQFNNIAEPLLKSCLFMVIATRAYLHELIKAQIGDQLIDRVVQLASAESFEQETALYCKPKSDGTQERQILYENQLLWLLKLQRLSPTSQTRSLTIRVHALDHFVRREVAKKIAEERSMDDMEAQVLDLPFKMKVQSIMDDNKAIDELTAKDKERLEREAEQEIEVNFPSYFDEFQKLLYSLSGEGTGRKDGRNTSRTGEVEMQHREVSIEQALGELTKVTNANEDIFRSNFLRERLEIVQMCWEQTEVIGLSQNEKDIKIPTLVQSFIERDNQWMEDAVCSLEDQIKQSQLRSVMNIADLQLSSSYNFYHDSIPQEARLMYQPLAKLQARVRDILSEYESPILNDVLFLSNYMLTSFNTKSTPLMKILTGAELLLEKLEEWEPYASKKLNSCHEEMNLLKQLIIRYRKIQILSWRNLLNHRRLRMIKEDFNNCVRLFHTVERQIFDEDLYKEQKKAANSSKNLHHKGGKVELQTFELLDLFIRNSSLGLFESRLEVIQLLFDSLTLKERHLNEKETDELSRRLISLPDYDQGKRAQILDRLRKVLNILHFVLGYYGQFRGKLQRTIARLDAASRDKIKTLIDVSKWSVQKFTVVKSNIDKTHRQLYRACQQEEEILMQNIQSLVLTSSRKKYINTDAGGDKLLSLDAEKKTVLQAQSVIRVQKIVCDDMSTPILKQLEFFEKQHIETKWPNSTSLEYAMLGMFERLKTVRDLNKKHLQRKAFIDLLKYMKDNGLKANFQEKIQPLIIKSKLVNIDGADGQLQGRLVEYFYKAQELLMITESSSQVDENADLKNIDVIRIQGFSKSLMSNILLINVHLSNLEERRNQLKNSIQLKEIKKTSEVENGTETIFTISPEKCQLFVQQRNIFMTLRENTTSQVNTILLLEQNSKITQFKTDLEETSLTEGSYELLKTEIEQFVQDMTKVRADYPSSRRIKKITDACLIEVSQLSNMIHTLIYSSNVPSHEQESSDLIQKRSTLLAKYIQLLYQDVYGHVVEFWEQQANDQQKETARKESFDKQSLLTAGDDVQNVAIPQTNQEKTLEGEEEDNTADLGIDQQQDFTKKLIERFNETEIEDPKKKTKSNQSKPKKAIINKIQDVSQKLFDLEGIHLNHCLSSSDQKCLSTSKLLIKKVLSLLDFVLRAQGSFLISLCKFSYLTQRIFLYLIFQGFCGQEDESDPQEQPDDKFLENDGAGMGDGQGQNNVSNEIDHEEQLEGLKNYESEPEQEEQEKEDNKDNKSEDDNDFEMKEDFDGEMEDEEKKEDPEEDKKSDEDKEDDALDKVDDMLDNQLWNKNMEDMEQKEEENGEKDDEEKEEIDLGDRELDKQNQMDQKEKELAAGDNDKQQDEKEEDGSQMEDQEDDEVRRDEDKEDDEEEKKDESVDEMDNNNDIALDRDELIEEDEQSKKSGEDSQKADSDQEMSDAESMPEENPEALSNQEEKDEQEILEDKPEGFQEKDHEDQENQESDDNEKDPDHIGDDKNVMDKPEQEDEGDQEQEDTEQANLKDKLEESKNENQQEQKNENQNQSDQQMEMQTEFDVNGSDILFQLAQKIQEQAQKKQDQKEAQKKQKQEKLDLEKQQVEQPKMNDKQEERPDKDQQQQEDDQAMEYEFDEEAEQMQGKLAADNLEEKCQDKDQVENQDDKTGLDNDQEMEDNEGPEIEADDNIQKTEAQAKATDTKDVSKKDKTTVENEKMEDQVNENEELEEQIDLVDDYQKFLQTKQQMQNQQDDDKMEIEKNLDADLIEVPDLEDFDYQNAKMATRVLFDLWRSNPEIAQESIALLSRFKAETGAASASLCEQLRIVLEPQLSQQLMGDYRTGKRLNMKKVISFIASHYRNDKIWLRRTLPSKRDYKILIAIDDSLSMNEQNLGFFSLEAMVTLVEALNRLEVGKVAVARIRDRMEILQSFEDSYSNERSAFIVSQYEFKHSGKNSHDFAMANFVKDANQLLDLQNTQSQIGGSISCPFVIILSDGRFNKNNVRKYMQEAQEKKYLYIFVILDAPKPTSATSQQKSGDQSQAGILSLRSAIKQPGQQGIKLVPYLKDFPFTYYCIVRDLHQLPSALGSILVQWFSIMASSTR